MRCSAADAGLVKGKTVGIDATILEANAGLTERDVQHVVTVRMHTGE